MLLWAFSSTMSMFFHQNCQEGHHKPKTPIVNGLFYNFRMASNKKVPVCVGRILYKKVQWSKQGIIASLKTGYMERITQL